jgi:hypothetical protein
VNIVLTNAILVGAIFISAGVVLIANKRVKDFVILASIGGVAALSLLPYAAAYSKARDWDILIRRDVGWIWMIKQLAGALSNPTTLMLIFWIILGLLILIGAFVLLVRPRESSGNDNILVYFALISVVLVPIAQLTFFTVLRYQTQEWYYLGVIVILIVGFDWLSGVLCQRLAFARIIRLLFVVSVLVVSLQRAFGTACVRMTNVDLAATYLRSHANPDDYVIVAPWYTGITFAHEYNTPLGWDTLPPITDLRIHRYDLCQEQMTSADPLGPVLARAAKCLQSGHSVWILTSDYFATPRERPSHLAPAPHDSAGWNEDAYRYAWSMELAYFIQTHTAHVDLKRPQDELTNPFENAMVVQAAGSDATSP